MAIVALDLREQPLHEGRAFGTTGAYVELIGEAEFAVDPRHPLNQAITDLDLAPRDTRGCVRFAADVQILRPADPANGNGGIFLDVPNRGNSVFCRMLEPGPMAGSTGITAGFLLRRGFSIVTCGWQHDVPRGDGSFGLSAPYVESVGSAVTGVGFLALRDLLSDLRMRYTLDFAVALGGSQSGRVLRHLVYLGMCEDEDGRLVLDGVLPIATGARMTEANLRFGEPSSNGPKSSAFPVTDGEILARARERGIIPKIMHLNTSSEYWSSAALEHISAAVCHTAFERDVDLPDDVRMYLCASTQHAPASMDAVDDGRGIYPPNTIDYKPFVRAAVDNLTAWVTRAVAPPPSVYPRFSDGTLDRHLHSTCDADGNEVGGLRHPDVAVPLATYTGWNPSREDPHSLVRSLGSTRAFTAADIAARYPSRANFLTRVRLEAEALADQRYLVLDDVESIVRASAERWDNCTT